MRKAFIIYASVVCLIATMYSWGKLIRPAGNAAGGGARSGSSWSSNSGGGSWGGGSGGGHK